MSDLDQDTIICHSEAEFEQAREEAIRRTYETGHITLVKFIDRAALIAPTASKGFRFEGQDWSIEHEADGRIKVTNAVSEWAEPLPWWRRLWRRVVGR